MTYIIFNITTMFMELLSLFKVISKRELDNKELHHRENL